MLLTRRRLLLSGGAALAALAALTHPRRAEASFSAKILSITQKPTTGSLGYTGVGFQPKALICLGTTKTADGSAGGAASYVGLAGTATQYSTISEAQDSQSTPSAVVAQSKSLLIQSGNDDGSASLTAAAALTSLDADGFTLNWTTTDGVARVWLILCLGGADLTNAFVSDAAAKTTTGLQSYTEPAFQPDAVLFAYQAASTSNPVSIGIGTATQGLGAMTAAEQFYTSGRHKSSVNPTVQRRAQKSTGVLGFLTDAGWQGEASFSSFDANGYTLDWTQAGAGAYLVGYLALKGLQAKILSFTSPAATGQQSYTGAGFTPIAAIFSSMCQSASTANTADCRRMIGLATAAAQGVISWASEDAVSGSSNASQNLDRTACVKHIVQGHGAPTFPSVAAFVGFISGGLTLDWTVADATARETFVLLLGPAAAAGTVTRHRAVSY